MTGYSGGFLRRVGLLAVFVLSIAGSGRASSLSSGGVSTWGCGGYDELDNGTFYTSYPSDGSDTPVDVSGLSGVAAVAAGGYHSLALEQAVPTILHTYTGTGWHLISSPFTLSQSFASLSITAFAFDPVTQNYAVAPAAPADAFHTGQGYWTYVRGASLDIPGPGTLADSTQPFSITLGQGWNLVGNPFDAATPLANVTVTDPSGVSVPYTTALSNHIVSALFVYDNATGGYQVRSASTDGLNPWDGEWIYCKQAGTRLVFNPLPSVPS